MALVRIPGGFWVPTMHRAFDSGLPAASDLLLVDADQEEAQIIGRVCLAAGSGSKTFGTSGSKVGWLPGASITFAVNSTLTVGVKKSTTIDDANGPPGRATIGSAAFDVSKVLTGGTDTITATTWRDDAMNAGTPYTVAHGDRVAVCFLLATTAGTPSVKVRCSANVGGATMFPVSTLVTSGPTYTAQGIIPNVVLTFDDGTLGWIDPEFVFTQNSSENIGNGNLYGNVVQLPFNCTVDAVAAVLATAGTTNFDIGLYSTPNSTPTAMSNGVISVDPQNVASTSARFLSMPLTAEVSLSAGTAYYAAVKQNSASSIGVVWYDVNAAGHFQANGLDSNSFAAKSTAGAAVSTQNSGLRRMAMWMRISQVDNGTSIVKMAGDGGGFVG